MLETHGNYTLENLPPEAEIVYNFKAKELPEVVGYSTLERVLSGVDDKILNVNYLFRYALKPELLSDGVYIPLTYGNKDSNKVVLIHCGYELALEQFYVNFVQPMNFSDESVKLFIDKYFAYIGDRAEREAAYKLEAKIQELAALTGQSTEALRKKLGVK